MLSSLFPCNAGSGRWSSCRGSVSVRSRFRVRAGFAAREFSEFDAPLIQRMDLPNDPLGEDGMFIESNELPKHSGVRVPPGSSLKACCLRILCGG